MGELEDFRHLYAHNDAGETDAECGAQLRSHRLSLDLGDLRYYASTAQSVLGYFSVM